MKIQTYTNAYETFRTHIKTYKRIQTHIKIYKHIHNTKHKNGKSIQHDIHYTKTIQTHRKTIQIVQTHIKCINTHMIQNVYTRI